MQTNGKAHDKNQDAIEAMNRVLSGSEGSDFESDCKIIGRALRSELQARDAATSVKVFNPKTLKAAKDFERIMQTPPMRVKLMERTYDPMLGVITYVVNLPRVLFANTIAKGVTERFAEIVRIADAVDIGVEDENPETEGLLYFEITFNVVIRA